jgi:hypothetical protein
MNGIINRIKKGFKAFLICTVIPIMLSACWEDLEEISVKAGEGGPVSEITIAAISGVAAPFYMQTPVTEITETDQYTGTVTWSGSPVTFAATTVYTATITLTAKSGYTLTGVAADFFTVAGATPVNNSADSGVVTAVFPITGSAPPTVINIAAVPGVTLPVLGGTPVTVLTGNLQYSGTVSWSPSHNPFQAATTYTATINLTPKSGYTLTGVAANFFTVAGVTSDTNPVNSGVVTAVFPATGYCKVTYNVGTGNTSGSVPVDGNNYNSGATVTVLGNTGDLRGSLIVSGIKQRFIGWNTNSGATTAQYIAGSPFNITGNITLYAIYTTGADVLRKVGPAGGLIFYDHGSTQAWGRYLECAPSSTEWYSKIWGGYMTTVSGADGITVGTGEQNTTDIVTQFGAADPYEGRTDYAAKLCSDLIFGGESDWFLPSKNELHLMYVNLHGYNLGGFNTARPYWSSSEYNSYNAWTEFFTDGSAEDGGKDMDELSVRAVRAF